jgi:hypothetical protein
MANTIKTVAGNTAPDWAITCERTQTDGSVSAIDLTGCTVELIVKELSSGTITQAAGAATITTAASGIISYTPESTDIPNAGDYVADIKITYADTSYEILYDQLKIKARDPIS